MSTNQIAPTAPTAPASKPEIVPFTAPAGAKVVRLSKKDFFARLPKGTGTAEKLRRFAAYADTFGSGLEAQVRAAVANGDWQSAGAKVSKSGTILTVKYVRPVSDAQSVKEKLADANAATEAAEARAAALEAKLAALESRLSAALPA